MIKDDVILGQDVPIFQPDLVNLYGCSIGDHTKIGAFVEIQGGTTIGQRCKISSHAFICAGVQIEHGVFIGHGVMNSHRDECRSADPPRRRLRVRTSKGTGEGLDIGKAIGGRLQPLEDGASRAPPIPRADSTDRSCLPPTASAPIIACALAPVNGGSPASISYRTVARAVLVRA